MNIDIYNMPDIPDDDSHIIDFYDDEDKYNPFSRHNKIFSKSYDDIPFELNELIYSLMIRWHIENGDKFYFSKHDIHDEYLNKIALSDEMIDTLQSILKNIFNNTEISRFKPNCHLLIELDNNSAHIMIRYSLIFLKIVDSNMIRLRNSYGNFSEYSLDFYVQDAMVEEKNDNIV